jgi:hypothetical protein
MGKSPKRHLVVSPRNPSRAACGITDPPLWTYAPAEVTCGGCAKSIAMADREIELLNQPRNQRPAF